MSTFQNKMCAYGIIFIGTLLSLSLGLKFSNVKCKSLDETLGSIRVCKLTVPQRGRTAVMVHYELYRTIKSDITMVVSLRSNRNKFQRVVYNDTMDFCTLILRKMRSPLLMLLSELLQTYSNINHTCPYDVRIIDHDIIVKDLYLKDEYINVSPYPFRGEFVLRLLFMHLGDRKLDIQIFLRNE